MCSNWSLNEVSAYVTLPYARYHVWIPDGTYELVITSANGVHTKTVAVTQGSVHDFLVCVDEALRRVLRLVPLFESVLASLAAPFWLRIAAD